MELAPVSGTEDDAASLYARFVEDLGDQSLAQLALDCLRRHFGGQRVYVKAPDNEARDAEIRRRYNGRNRIEICHEFKISRSALYKIVGRRP